MKCLSVAQPFADLIVEGKKTIELRSWNTKFRGEFLIHSPKKIRIKDCERLEMKRDFVVGAIIGKAEIYDVKNYKNKIELERDSKLHFAKTTSKMRYGFLLKNAKKLRYPIPYKGRLGFFNVDLPKVNITKNDMISDIIDEEFRYQWIGHH